MNLKVFSVALILCLFASVALAMPKPQESLENGEEQLADASEKDLKGSSSYGYGYYGGYYPYSFGYPYYGGYGGYGGYGYGGYGGYGYGYPSYYGGYYG